MQSETKNGYTVSEAIDVYVLPCSSSRVRGKHGPVCFIRTKRHFLKELNHVDVRRSADVCDLSLLQFTAYTSMIKVYLIFKSRFAVYLAQCQIILQGISQAESANMVSE